jgi:hypothetical protein
MYPRNWAGFPMPPLGIEIPGQSAASCDEVCSACLTEGDELENCTNSCILQWDFDHLAKSTQEDRESWLKQTGGDRGITLCYPVLPVESEATMQERYDRLAKMQERRNEIHRSSLAFFARMGVIF